MMTMGFLAELITAYLGRDQESYSIKEKTTAGRHDAPADVAKPVAQDEGK
jgi:hypothetical protein